MVEHLVALRLKPSAAPDEVEALLQDVRRLPQVVPGILALHCGRNFSPGRAHGFDLALHVRFPGREELAAYGPHPEHQKVLARIQALCDDVLALDFDA